jgi:hypothetical protein
MIQILWDRSLEESRLLRRADFLRLVMREVERAIGDRPDRADIIDEFISLGSVQRLPDGTLIEIQPNGEEVRAAA